MINLTKSRLAVSVTPVASAMLLWIGLTVGPNAMASCTLSGSTDTCTGTGTVFSKSPSAANGILVVAAGATDTASTGMFPLWSSITNNGTLSLTTTNGRWNLSVTNFSNTGTLSGEFGQGYIYFNQNLRSFTNSGTISIVVPQYNPDNTVVIGGQSRSNAPQGGYLASQLADVTNTSTGVINGKLGINGEINTLVNAGTITSIGQQSGSNLVRTLTNSGGIGTIQDLNVTTLNNQGSGSITTFNGQGTYTVNNAGTITNYHTGYVSTFNPTVATFNNTGTVGHMLLSAPVAWSGALPTTRITLIPTQTNQGMPAVYDPATSWQGIIDLGSANLTTLGNIGFRLQSGNGLNPTGTTTIKVIKTTGQITAATVTGTQNNIGIGSGNNYVSNTATYTSQTSNSGGFNWLELVYSLTPTQMGGGGMGGGSMVSPPAQMVATPTPMQRARSFASSILSANTFNALSPEQQETAARKLMPTTASAGSSSSGQTSLSATGMVFEKAGTFTGDLSGVRATQSRLSAREQRDFHTISNAMHFNQIAENLSVAPVAFRTASRISYSMIEGAKASNYDKLTPGEMSGWIQGNVTYNKLDTHDNVLGSTTHAATIIGAVERAINEDSLIGVMHSRTDSDSTVKEDAGTIKNKQSLLGIYGQKLYGDVKVTGIVTYGQNNFDSLRKVSIGNVTEYAAAKYDGITTQVSLGVSQKFDHEGMTLEPFALATNTVNKTDAFSESGAAMYGLSVGATKSRDFAITLGTVLTQGITFAGYPAQLKLKPALRFNNQVKAADASITVGSSTGTAVGRVNDSLIAQFAAAVHVQQSKTRTLKLGADVEQSSNVKFGKLFAQYEVKF